MLKNYWVKDTLNRNQGKKKLKNQRRTKKIYQLLRRNAQHAQHPNLLLGRYFDKFLNLVYIDMLIHMGAVWSVFKYDFKVKAKNKYQEYFSICCPSPSIQKN